MHKRFYFSLILFLFSMVSSVASAGYAVKNIYTYSSKLLTVIKWDQKYDLDRKTDIDYLLGSVNSSELNGLNDQQKKEVVTIMRKMALDQMIKDRDYFKNYLLEQYNQFFTIDELQKLIQYYQTDVMQMGIDAKLNHTQITVKEINDQLLNSKASDKRIIAWFRDSYLNARYTRFLDSVNPKLNNMIVNRLKEVLDMVIKKIPEIAKYIKDNQTGSGQDFINASK